MNVARVAKVPLVVACSVALSGCAKASAEDCAKMIDHMFAIQLDGAAPADAELGRTMMAEEKKDLVAECEGKVTKAQVDCVMAAKTRADIVACKGT